MQCSRCQHENPAGMKFCGQCAAPLASACPSCGAANPPGNKYCGQCAAPLTKATESRFESPETYTPKHLAEKILTSRSALEGERKQVTVLFADLKGSMELLADRDPEEARKLLDPVLLVDVEEEVRGRADPPGAYHRKHLLGIIEAMRGQIIERGLFTEHELAALTGALERHLDDPRTVVTRPLLFQAWGRKPD